MEKQSNIQLSPQNLQQIKKCMVIANQWHRGIKVKEFLSHQDQLMVEEVKELIANLTHLESGPKPNQKMLLSLTESFTFPEELRPSFSKFSFNLMLVPWIWQADKFKRFGRYTYQSFPSEYKPKRPQSGESPRDDFRRGLFITVSFEINKKCTERLELKDLEKPKQLLQSYQSVLPRPELCFFKVKSTYYFGLVSKLCTADELSRTPEKYLNQILTTLPSSKMT